MTALNYLRRRSGRALQFLQPHKYNVCNNLRLFLRNESSFVPKRVLIVSKLSRYHFEKMREPEMTDEQLRVKLEQRGSDYDMIWASHVSNENVKYQVTEVLRKLNIEYKIINRDNLNSSNFSWADLILPIGGDGTLLLASNMIFDNTKPIMGINSHPERSEGYLMLPPKYTHCIPDIFEMLRAGNYKIIMRRRIRTTIMGDDIWDPPFHTHEKARIIGGEKLYTQHLSKEVLYNLPKERRLPWLALNEVFVAETLSAKTSTLLIKLNNEEKYILTKSSGICVSTGTGSTSWYKAIVSVTPQTIREILSFMKEKRQFSKEEVDKIASTFNDSLAYSPDELRLCYVIRDMIISDALPVSKYLKPRGFCDKLTVRSQSYDAGIVIDSGIAVPFNFGTTAVLETYPEDSLRCLSLLE
ncbi:NAD kinase 2, mitochondrial isoform X1 [Ceratina calcarata]|uniref:NAD(+) kinase n=2 Tax=Ceratina calcarata TaxID=156304 RepID=A0AAJ7SAT3_9HYME|nr:NAD kinase 2, mitochondrial isoform X1 [Ceratina calcarata]XP_026674656.1 NAD kinase 2, mitochondrial isoform X1 [Ceratina calcarata]